jgi:hypothetical protein
MTRKQQNAVFALLWVLIITGMGGLLAVMMGVQL